MAANNSNGFTLIELIVVLVIVGLLSGLALPRMFNSLTHVELKNAARQTVVLLNRARDMAYFQRTKVWVRFDGEKNRIVALKEDTAQKAERKQIEGMGYELPEEVSLSEGNMTEMLFSSNGSSSGGTLILRNLRGREYRIRVDIITGHARIVN